jgi:hypothetical protein
VDYNALDNRKCTICDFVFDQDCDDCPAMPMLIKMWKDRAIIQQQVQPDNGGMLPEKCMACTASGMRDGPCCQPSQVN